jgi:hypothetical protein
LAFRELGLAIGLAAVDRLRADPHWSTEAAGALAGLAPYRTLRSAIEAFWLDDAHRDQETWRAHQDINDVMLATALAPEGFLVRRPVATPKPEAPRPAS